MNIKRNIIFSLESRKKEGKPIVVNVPIRMRVVYAGQRIEFTTGYHRRSKMGHRQTAGKKRMLQQTQTKCIRNKCRPLETLLPYSGDIQRV
ncbi:hypothetical protein EZS27_011071 [termite gut metagenome]|uniref:Uncharacterized protein n=1 Tax=termite gut metagenome TaxID=433724 RepID=A0A5J4S4J4_9ZZZZ